MRILAGDLFGHSSSGRVQKKNPDQDKNPPGVLSLMGGGWKRWVSSPLGILRSTALSKRLHPVPHDTAVPQCCCVAALVQVSDMKQEAPKAMQYFINQSIDYYMGPYSTDLTGIAASFLRQGNKTRLMFANAGSTYWLYQCVQDPLPADCQKAGDRRNPGLYGTMTASNEQWYAVVDHAFVQKPRA